MYHCITVVLINHKILQLVVITNKNKGSTSYRITIVSTLKQQKLPLLLSLSLLITLYSDNTPSSELSLPFVELNCPAVVDCWCFINKNRSRMMCNFYERDLHFVHQSCKGNNLQSALHSCAQLRKQFSALFYLSICYKYT